MRIRRWHPISLLEVKDDSESKMGKVQILGVDSGSGFVEFCYSKKLLGAA